MKSLNKQKYAKSIELSTNHKTKIVGISHNFCSRMHIFPHKIDDWTKEYLQLGNYYENKIHINNTFYCYMRLLQSAMSCVQHLILRCVSQFIEPA